jgi:hypothetical protein
MRRFALRTFILLVVGCSADTNHIRVGGDDAADCAGSALACDADPIDPEDESDPDEPGDGDGDGDGDDWEEERDAGPPPVGDACKPEDIVPEGCMERTSSESTAGLCDGLDNDCDGEVDEGCVCVPGTVQRCFAGPPGRRNVGGCEAGTQTCEGVEFGKWGECKNGRVPEAEVCDSLDNDCNGCVDEIAGCKPDLACPAPGDPRVPDGAPFSTYPLRGGDFVGNVASVASWEWTVTGTPCDTMFLAIPGSMASATNGQLSFTLSNADRQDASIQFTLSGDYTVKMKVTLHGGSVIVCTWVVHVRAPGVRVELCWDTTGPTSAGGTPIDIDLHLGKHGSTPSWFDAGDCYYAHCRPDDSPRPDWGYVPSPVAACQGASAGFIETCSNPRLDIDNIYTTTRYVPENINVDNPRDGDEFRVMVHHYSYGSAALPVSAPFDSHPLVNVYCGGELAGTFGAAPNRLAGFRDGGGDRGGDMWRVVDITAEVDAAGVTTHCGLEPLSAPGMAGVPWVTTGDPTF